MIKYYKILSFDDLNHFVKNVLRINQRDYFDDYDLRTIPNIIKIDNYIIIKIQTLSNGQFTVKEFSYSSETNYKEYEHLAEIYKAVDKTIEIINKIEEFLNSIDNADNKN